MGAPTMFTALIDHPRASPSRVRPDPRHHIRGRGVDRGRSSPSSCGTSPTPASSTGYGATELASGVSRADHEDLAAGRLVGVGRPNAGCEIRVIDADRRRPTSGRGGRRSSSARRGRRSATGTNPRRPRRPTAPTASSTSATSAASTPTAGCASRAHQGDDHHRRRERVPDRGGAGPSAPIPASARWWCSACPTSTGASASRRWSRREPAVRPTPS